MLSDEIGIDVSYVRELGIATHVFTHIRWSIKVLEFNWVAGALPDYPETKWIRKDEIETYAFPTAYKKALRSGSLL